MRRTSGRLGPVPTRLMVLVGTVALVGVLLSALSFVWLDRALKRAAAAEFSDLAHNRALALDTAFARSLAMFGSIEGLFHASKQVERAEVPL